MQHVKRPEIPPLAYINSLGLQLNEWLSFNIQLKIFTPAVAAAAASSSCDVKRASSSRDKPMFSYIHAGAKCKNLWTHLDFSDINYPHRLLSIFFFVSIGPTLSSTYCFSSGAGAALEACPGQFWPSGAVPIVMVLSHQAHKSSSLKQSCVLVLVTTQQKAKDENKAASVAVVVNSPGVSWLRRRSLERCCRLNSWYWVCTRKHTFSLCWMNK